MKQVSVKNFQIGKGKPLTIICGPCVIESEEHCLRSAEAIKEILKSYPVNFIFKSSYDKANRSAHHSFRGPGLEEGLRILQRVQNELGLPVVTDVHSPEEATAAGEVCDALQIPAFLCRQTDLITAAAKTKATIQVKKGQFMAPWDMKNVVDKIEAEGNHNILLIDRGTSFGYNNLVSDMRCIPIMQKLGYPVCFDATHSVQLPGGQGTTSGGESCYVPVLAKAAIAAGANALFLEAHDTPKSAKSDSATQISFEELKLLLPIFVKLHEIINE